MTQLHTWTNEQAASANIPNFGKKYIGEQELLRMTGENLIGKNVLELGSGNGYWLQFLADRGAICTGIELAEEQLALAKQDGKNITIIKGDITKAEDYPPTPGSFDIVLLEHVLLEIPQREQLDKIMNNAWTMLKPDGELIISELHPIVPSLHPHNIRTAPDFNYFSSGAVIEVISKRLDGQETVYQDIHWTLSDLVGSMTRAGFLISALHEPRPTEEQVQQYPELAYRRSIPMGLWIKAIRK